MQLNNKKIKNRLETISSISDIPDGVCMVYILSLNEVPIALGHGHKNRARVIFDTAETITSGHIKSLPIRLHSIYGDSNTVIQRFIVRCSDKKEACEFEKQLHREIGGNTTRVPEHIYEKIFFNIEKGSLLEFILKAALSSSFDGHSDLRRWRRKGLITDELWSEISERLKLPARWATLEVKNGHK